jgi:tetratricopeptide (TPR) repeat protein
MSYFRKALSISPQAAVLHANLGQLLQQLNRHEEALHHFEQVRLLDPGSPTAYSGYAIALRTMGRLEEANAQLEQAIAMAPREPSLYRVLGYSRPFRRDDPYLAALEAMAADTGDLPEDKQTELYFALAKAYQDTGQHERSFRHLLKANALLRPQKPYSESVALPNLEQSRAVFNAEVMRQRRGLGHPSDLPIFIVGMPRSGSTLIEQILASHPDVFGAGELRDFGFAIEGLDRGPSDTPEEVSGDDLYKLGERYLAMLQAKVPVPAKRATDKMLGNSRFVGLIHLALPNATIIHARRNALDNCLSCFGTMFAEGHGYTYDLGELGRYYRAHEALMDYWPTVLPEGVMLTVNYEDLVDDLETHARRIIAHCGLEWTDACLEFHKTERPVYTASVVQVRQPIYRTSVGRWKPYQSLLQPLFEGLGIEPPEG